MRVVAQIEPINQAVIATVQVPMLSTHLTIRSDWTTARKASYRWVLEGLTPNSSHVIHIAGRDETLQADAAGAATFTWDGLDANRTPVGPSLATAQFDGSERSMRLGRWDPREVGLGGLMFSGYDHLDPVAQRIHAATGRSKANISARPTDAGFEASRNSGRIRCLFDHDGFLTSVADSKSGRVSASYDRNEDGLTQASRGHRVVTVQREGDARKLQSHGWDLRLISDHKGRVTQLIDPSERGVRFGYDAAGLLTTITDASGFIYSYQYDEDGRLVGAANPSDGNVDLVRIATEHGYRVSMISPEGRESFQQVERLPDGTKVRTSKCCGRHEAVTRIDPVSIEMDRPDGSKVIKVKATGRRQVVLPSGLTHTRTVRGDQITVNGNTYRYSEDETGATSTSPMGRVSKISTSDNAVRITGPHGSTEMVKDDLGRVTRISGGEMALDAEYDDAGLLVSARWSDGTATRFEYDPSGWLTAQHLSDQRVARLERDGAGFVRKVVTPGGGETRFDLAAPGRLASVQFPSRGGLEDRIEYRYDRDGLLVSRQVSGAPPVSFVRGVSGEIESIAGASSAVTIEYDNGRPVKGTTSDGQVTRIAYDGNLVTAIAYEGRVNGSIAYEYDEGFRRSRISSGALSADLLYDADGQVIGVGEATIERDQAGRVVSITTGAATQAYAYSEAGQVTRMVVSAHGNKVWAVEYAYDSRRRVASLTDSSASGGSDFSYDDAGRLVGAEGFEAEYGPNGNPISINRGGVLLKAAHDPGDRLANLEQTEMSYGAGGTIDGIGGMALARDDQGAVISVSKDRTTTTLRRDALGNLIAIDPGDASAVSFVSGPHGRPEAIHGSDGRLQAMFVGGTRTDTPLLAVEANRTLFIAVDHVGSVRRVIDIATGEIVESRDYDVWGRLVAHEGSSPVPYGFGGGIDDPPNDLVHFPARTYSPELLRWLSRDPELFLGGSANLYTYCNNDPVNYRDPTGTTVEICRQATDIAPDWFAPGAEHWWIRTAKNEAGMIPGRDEVGVGDHTGRGDQDGSECDRVDDVDEDCVDRAMALPNIDPESGMRIGEGLGMYGPGNTCQNWVDEVLSACSGNDYSVETTDPDAYDHWYSPDVKVEPYSPAYPPIVYTPDSGQSTLDGGSLWE